ncbi:putative F-box/LRR-repeat protein 3 [Cocos nucifera]|uniref:Putative F-box/LRR-repeat protein 3 n=1 Tax=Cocos nucifera TaxID=13894 RepID=A0A8K0IRN3_COCNU|nr:putative F-box/LRR-repeat protein 3 [Cocos nucifera]
MMRTPQPPDLIMAVLSVDLLVQILERLPDSGDRKSFRLVSRGFLRAEALHRRALRVLRRESLPFLLRRYSDLESLDLSACPALDDTALAAALHTAGGRQGLKAVCLARATGIGWRGLEVLVAACPRLEVVDLSYCVGVGDREASALAAAGGLRELRLDKCLGITDVGLAKLAVGCTGLERLGIKWCMEISDLGIDLLSKKCQDLKVLDISYLKVTNFCLQSISSLEKLEDLIMVGCSQINDGGLRFLSNGSNSLRSIDVSRCNNVSTWGLVSVIEGHKCLQKIIAGDCFPEIVPLFLAKLSGLSDTLNVLKLDGFQVSATSLQIIGVHCKNLVEIGLGKCRDMTDECISELVTHRADLRTIDLTCCHSLTDNALVTIADRCKKLTCLLLESCSLITEKGLDHIGTCCTDLKEVDLTDCPVDDTGLCPSISDKGLVHIGSNFRKLLELDLYRCTGIADGGLAAIAAGCKHLKKLNMCYCVRITDRGLKHLSFLEELSDLEMRGLVHVTCVGITAIAIGCKSLVELDMKRCYSVDDAGLWALARYSEKLRQINISYCPVTGTGLCKLLGSLRCLQDAKLVHLTRVSVEGYEIALRASWDRLKKLKLLSGLRHFLSPGLLQMLKARGCRIRWVDKPESFCLPFSLLLQGEFMVHSPVETQENMGKIMIDQSPSFKHLEIRVDTEARIVETDAADGGDGVVQEFLLGGPESSTVRSQKERSLEESELVNRKELKEEEFSFSVVEFTEIQDQNNQNLEESGLDRVQDEEEKDYREDGEAQSFEEVEEFSFRVVESDTMQNQTKQTLEESKIAHAREQGGGGGGESNDDVEAPSSESSVKGESEREEEGSDGTGSSSIESSAEAVWPAEVIEQERWSLFLESHQEIEEESCEEKVTAAEKEIEEYEEKFGEKVAAAEESVGKKRGAGTKTMKRETKIGLMPEYVKAVVQGEFCSSAHADFFEPSTVCLKRNIMNSSSGSSSDSGYEASNHPRKHKHDERSRKVCPDMHLDICY